jgi:succinyl-diaminopimelate desuccinylase
MQKIQWLEEAKKREQTFIEDTQAFLRIRSILDESTAKEGMPFGEKINEALHYVLKQCEEAGLTTKVIDGYAAHAEMGEGEELIGILCHVDVVPEGEGWTSPPFAAEIRDGKIYARGAIDDKGPTMAAVYAVKLIKELGLPLNKRVRLIFGTDEESGFRCVKHYFQHEEMPTLGFAPDADFPIIHAEKGSANFTLTRTFSPQTNENRAEATLLSFEAGHRLNMVPESVKAVFSGSEGSLIHMSNEFQKFLTEHHLKGEAVREGRELRLTLIGKSAHAMNPTLGINAGLVLAHFLDQQVLDEQGANFVELLEDYLYNDTVGTKLNIVYEDEVSGALTVNVGIIRYQYDEEARVHINMRYPVTGKFEAIESNVRAAAERMGFDLKEARNSKPHFVEPDSTLIRTLQRVYKEQTGMPATLLSTGGGTYARVMDVAVAFGPLFPGRPDSAHQKDEHVYIEDLIKAIAIYAQCIYELANEA